MTQNDRNMIKYYLKKYFNIRVKKFTQEKFFTVNWNFYKKHNVTLQEMLMCQKLANEIENELHKPMPIVEHTNGKLYFRHNTNKNLYLVVDEFST